MNAAEKLAPEVGTAAACRAMGVSRATLYRRRNPSRDTSCVRPTRKQPRALDEAERRRVLDLLHSPRFVDQAPAAVHAALLDEGKYLCSIRTMYRILHDANEVRERRNQLRHPNYKKPELLATGPNQVWSWDITKLLGPAKWTYYYLYVILDIYSRYTVGWMLASRENADLAKRLIRESIERQNVEPGQLTIAGMWMPPSKRLRLYSRNGALLPPPSPRSDLSAAPLSLLKNTSVSPVRSSPRTSFMMAPTDSSMPATRAA